MLGSSKFSAQEKAFSGFDWYLECRIPQISETFCIIYAKQIIWKCQNHILKILFAAEKYGSVVHFSRKITTRDFFVHYAGLVLCSHAYVSKQTLILCDVFNQDSIFFLKTQKNFMF